MSNLKDTSTGEPLGSTPKTSWWAPLLAAVVLVGAGTWAYWDSFDGAFVLDDETSIQRHPDMDPRMSMWELLKRNRPLPRISLAANYRRDYKRARAEQKSLTTDEIRMRPNPGENVWGYHLVNLIVHLAAGVTLLGVVRRTLLSPRLREQFAAAATPLAFLVALIWMVHPLNTGAVTYVVQRAEAMVGLFLLLTLYAAIRFFRTDKTASMVVWIVVATIAGVLGMASKEVMVVILPIVLAYDLIFVRWPWRRNPVRRLALYLPLACTYAVLIVGRHYASGGGGAGFGGKGGLGAMGYAWTQFTAVLRYLQLSFWPARQCLDHGWNLDYGWTPPTFWAGILPMLLVVALLAATVMALWRKPVVGFVGLWFFLILAPSSSILPIKDAIFEHRMYLPLAAVVSLVVCGAYWLLRKLTAKGGGASMAPLLTRMAVAVALLAALGLGVLTDRRNAVFASESGVWRDVIDQYPSNARAHNNLGKAVYYEGVKSHGKPDERIARAMEGMPPYQRAVELSKTYADPLYNIGVLCMSRADLADATRNRHLAKAAAAKAGRNSVTEREHQAAAARNARVVTEALAEAARVYERAREIRPAHTPTLNNLGGVYSRQARHDMALECFQKALDQSPLYTLAYVNKAVSLEAMDRRGEAIALLSKVVEDIPDFAQGHMALGELWMRAGKPSQAFKAYKRALAEDEGLVSANLNVGVLLLRSGRAKEAVVHLAKAVEKAPGRPDFRIELAEAYTLLGRYEEAAENFRRVLDAQPRASRAYTGLGRALAGMKDAVGATAALHKAIELNPKDAMAYNEMGKVMHAAGNFQAAVDYYVEAIALAPDYADARNNLGVAYAAMGRGDLAVPHYNSAIIKNPRHLVARNNLARLRATCPIPEVRNGEQAVRIAEKVCRDTGNSHPGYVSTLAAAYARVGRFPDAIKTARQGMGAALEMGQDAVVARIRAELSLYEANQPLTERRRR